MKIIKSFLPLILALIPQFIFENYTLVVLFTVAVGFAGGWLLEDKKIFLKMALFQLIFFSILFFVSRGNVFYLNEVMQNLKLPLFLIPIVFILFNTLNVAILFLFGYRIQKLVFNTNPS